jgi:hypothetical protein
MTSNSSKTHVVLAIKNFAKSIPYAGRVRDDATNHGFKNVKGNAKAAASIPEVLDNEHLKSAIVAINGPHTAFFSVGCEKAFNEDEHGHWARGYIEISFNYRELVADAKWYFKLFFEFNREVFRSKFELPMQFYWELEGNTYFDTEPPCEGYSCAIWITTATFPTAVQARETWEASVDFLASYLVQFPQKPLTTIY